MVAPPLWYAMQVEQVLTELGSSASGLETADAVGRLALAGRNVLPHAKRIGPTELFLRQLRNPLAVVLLGSGVLTLMLGEATDALVVMAVVLLNAFIGALQERRARRAIEALAALVPVNVIVLRDGTPTTLLAAELVPGDVVLLEAGDSVPADLRVLSAHRFQVNEASLTGEPLPASKTSEPVSGESILADRRSMLFSGTFVLAGTATGIAVATGAATELGRLSELLTETKEPETPLAQKLGSLGELITEATCAVALVIFAVAHRRGFPLLDAVRSAVSFACAAIPVGLPAVVTITLAVSVRRMAACNTVVRTLPSVETLGSTTVICSDKTGTLTHGVMTVRRLWTRSELYEMTGAGYGPSGQLCHHGVAIAVCPPGVHELLRAAALCSDALVRLRMNTWVAVGDPTEVALVVAAEKVGLSVSRARARSPRVDAVPFDPTQRYMATLHEEHGGRQLVIVKGAPETVLGFCSRLAGTPTLDEQRILGVVDLLSASGMRVLAVASRRPLRRLASLSFEDLAPATFLGLVGSFDPPRAEAALAVARCHAAGIRVKMVTGDHPETARAIGAAIGLGTESRRVVTGPEIAKLPQAELEALAMESELFARVEPEHKLRLVKALQARGEVVAMTGDGVNDAPALKQADVGVAMGKAGTATAKQAADIVLVDDNFASIAAAVEEGRSCYDNLMKALMFLLPTNIGQSLVVLIGVLFFPVSEGLPLMPLYPLQVLWINLVTGVTLALPLAFEPAEPNLMRRGPRRREEPIFSRRLALRTVLVGTLITAGGVGLFLSEYFLARSEEHVGVAVSLERAQTMTATTVVLFQVFYLFQCRSLRRSIARMGLFSNPAVWAGVLSTVALHAAFVHLPAMNLLFHSSPLGAREWIVSALVATTVVPVVAVHKALP
jgi:magnesium-transporting ATPase (P-type)